MVNCGTLLSGANAVRQRHTRVSCANCWLLGQLEENNCSVPIRSNRLYRVDVLGVEVSRVAQMLFPLSSQWLFASGTCHPGVSDSFKAATIAVSTLTSIELPLLANWSDAVSQSPCRTTAELLALTESGVSVSGPFWQHGGAWAKLSATLLQSVLQMVNLPRRALGRAPWLPNSANAGRIAERFALWLGPARARLGL
jgi:hypothetical protein